MLGSLGLGWCASKLQGPELWPLVPVFCTGTVPPPSASPLPGAAITGGLPSGQGWVTAAVMVRVVKVISLAVHFGHIERVVMWDR